MLAQSQGQPQPGQQANTTTFLVRQEFFQGPIPPPGAIEAYAKIIQDGANRIMALAESQQKHRHVIESAVVSGNIKAQSTGQWQAFVLALVCVVGGFVLIFHGHSAIGISMVLGTIANLSGVFVWSKKQQERERKEKAQSVPER